MPQPLVPGRRDGYVSVVGFAGVLDDAAHTAGLDGPGVAELPVGIAAEVEA